MASASEVARSAAGPSCLPAGRLPLQGQLRMASARPSVAVRCMLDACANLKTRWANRMSARILRARRCAEVSGRCSTGGGAAASAATRGIGANEPCQIERMGMSSGPRRPWPKMAIGCALRAIVCYLCCRVCCFCVGYVCSATRNGYKVVQLYACVIRGSASHVRAALRM